MSDDNCTIKLPRDVWNMIANKASTDKVYIVNMRSNATAEDATAEVGVFQNKEEAYKMACNIMGNYYMGCCIDAAQTKGFKRLLDYIYFQIQPENTVLHYKDDEAVEYPKTYEQLLKNITTIAKHSNLTTKTYIEIIEKSVI